MSDNEKLGKYPQKPMWGLFVDGSKVGHRYMMSRGCYCDQCGFPADESRHFLKRGLCEDCASIPMTSYAERVQYAAMIASVELQEMAFKRDLIQKSRARSAKEEVCQT